MALGALAFKDAALDRGQSVGPRLYEALRTSILTARLRPGEALSEVRIAAQYGVSRTPVREIFRRLAEEGFLRIVPQVGTFVAPIKLDAVYDSQFVRETLECRVVALAAAKAGEADVRALRKHLRDQAQRIARKDHLGFFASDEAMHREIMEIAGHPTAWQLIASAKTQLDRVRYLSLESAEWLDMIFGQHEGIVARIAANDAARAETAMRAHLRTTFAAIERIAREHGDFFERGSVRRPARRRRQ